jgi:peptide/nickel transport system ATP-binding protein
MAKQELLEVTNLRVEMRTHAGVVPVLRGVELRIQRGEIAGLVGETGSGKTMTALAIMRLLPTPPMQMAGGQVLFDGEDLAQEDEAAMSEVRGKRMAMIFQDPVSYLNPVFTIGQQMVDVISAHSHSEPASSAEPLRSRTPRERAMELLRMVNFPEPDKRFDDYPHQISGGMAQRVMIAMALSGSPQFLIADEPTSALDVTVQAQILKLIHDLARSQGLSVLFITHNLAAMVQVCSRVNVMYLGQVVESSSVDELMRGPLHPYTQGLIQAVPTISSDTAKVLGIPGNIPSLFDLQAGCAFAARCPRREQICQVEEPVLQQAEPGRLVACHLWS